MFCIENERHIILLLEPLPKNGEFLASVPIPLLSGLLRPVSPLAKPQERASPLVARRSLSVCQVVARQNLLAAPVPSHCSAVETLTKLPRASYCAFFSFIYSIREDSCICRFIVWLRRWQHMSLATRLRSQVDWAFKSSS